MKPVLFVEMLVATNVLSFGQATRPATQPDSILTGDRLNEFWRGEAQKLNRPFEEYKSDLEREAGKFLLMDLRRHVSLNYRLRGDGALMINLPRAPSPERPQLNAQIRATIMYIIDDRKETTSVLYDANALHVFPGMSVG